MTNKTADSSQPDFWDSRYAGGNTPWDFHGVPSALVAFLGRTRPSDVLIPGCGTGYEVNAFHEAGWDVVAIDFSPVAVEQARRYLGSKLASAVILGDFFRYDFGGRQFSTIYERAFLCALPPHRWKAYVNRMTQLLRPNGRLAGTFFYGAESEGPPFPLTETKSDELFREKFQLLRSDPVADSQPFFAGKERWREWQLKSVGEAAGGRGANR